MRLRLDGPVSAFVSAICAAAAVIGLIAFAMGENPLRAGELLLRGSLGSAEGLGFTLFYTTSYIFTGLAVALPYRAGLFNIGAEGQGTVAGVVLSTVAFGTGGLPAWVTLPLCLIGGMVGGMAWSLLPGWLQVRRGAHVVITTIMLNFIASALLSYLLVDTLRAPGSMQPESRAFADATALPRLDGLLERLGWQTTGSPLNVSLLLSLATACALAVLLARTRLGYRIRVFGLNPEAAIYAGYSPLRLTLVVMGIAGLCVGGAAANELLGAQNRLLLDFMGGAGFVGIAVAFMGRNHPLGVIPAALLFGILNQGGAELAFEMPRITRDTIVLIQGLVVLLVGGTGLLPQWTRAKEA
jgi:simple sugar transport system permease protein